MRGNLAERRHAQRHRYGEAQPRHQARALPGKCHGATSGTGFTAGAASGAAVGGAAASGASTNSR